MSEIITPVVSQVGLGGVCGFVVGFALKKLTKLFIVVIGLFVLARLYLSINCAININYSALWTTITSGLALQGQQPPGLWGSFGTALCRQLCSEFPAWL